VNSVYTQNHFKMEHAKRVNMVFTIVRHHAWAIVLLCIEEMCVCVCRDVVGEMANCWCPSNYWVVGEGGVFKRVHSNPTGRDGEMAMIFLLHV
jgi:hypothetical protein